MSDEQTYYYADNITLSTVTGNVDYERYDSGATASRCHETLHSHGIIDKDCALTKQINNKIVTTGDYTDPRICRSYDVTKIFGAVCVVLLCLILALFGLHFSNQLEWRTGEII